MAPLYLHFDDSQTDLLGRFARVDHTSLGIFFADGSTSKNASGTLIFSGVAFDYTIVAAAKPDARAAIFCGPELDAIQSAITFDLGAAVASGQRVPIIIKTLLLLGDTLGTALGAKSVFWSPASVATGFAYYSDTVRQYVGGAAFPALITVYFDTAADDCVRTTGLVWLVGQELVFERGGMPVNAAMRYVVRIVHDLTTNGAVDAPIEVAGMSDDERLLFEPDAANQLLTVTLKHAQKDVNSAG